MVAPTPPQETPAPEEPGFRNVEAELAHVEPASAPHAPLEPAPEAPRALPPAPIRPPRRIDAAVLQENRAALASHALEWPPLPPAPVVADLLASLTTPSTRYLQAGVNASPVTFWLVARRTASAVGLDAARCDPVLAHLLTTFGRHETDAWADWADKSLSHHPSVQSWGNVALARPDALDHERLATLGPFDLILAPARHAFALVRSLGQRGLIAPSATLVLAMPPPDGDVWRAVTALARTVGGVPVPEHWRDGARTFAIIAGQTSP